MRYLLAFVFITSVKILDAQTVSVMDFVKIKEGKEKEALFFYNNNWKLYRDAALDKGFITDYRIEKVTTDSAATFDLILITDYKDKASYSKSEDNFRDILSSLRPNGPLLLNELKPADFRSNVFVKITERIARPKLKE